MIPVEANGIHRRRCFLMKQKHLMMSGLNLQSQLPKKFRTPEKEASGSYGGNVKGSSKGIKDNSSTGNSN